QLSTQPSRTARSLAFIADGCSTEQARPKPQHGFRRRDFQCTPLLRVYSFTCLFVYVFIRLRVYSSIALTLFNAEPQQTATLVGSYPTRRSQTNYTLTNPQSRSAQATARAMAAGYAHIRL